MNIHGASLEYQTKMHKTQIVPSASLQTELGRVLMIFKIPCKPRFLLYIDVLPIIQTNMNLGTPVRDSAHVTKESNQ